MKHGKFLLALFATCLGVLGGSNLHGATQTVVVGTFFFNPTNVSIFQGDTIIWTNRSTTTHDSSQGALSTPDAQRLWKSPNMAAFSGNYRFTFTNAGFYPYVCLQHVGLNPQQTGTVTVIGGNLPPSVTMTAPPGGSRHPSPPNFVTGATASDPDGIVTNVFFTATLTSGGAPVNLGSATTAPYSVLVTNLPPASYQFRAVAMDDAGVSSTSAVINVLIAVPVPLQLISPVKNGGQFEFDVATSFGMSYVVEESRGLEAGWTAVTTNTGNGANLRVSRPFDASSPTQRLYRAFIQP
jgi:plastocyanin